MFLCLFVCVCLGGCLGGLVGVWVYGQNQLPMLALYKALTWVTFSTSMWHIIHLNKQTPWIIVFCISCTMLISKGSRVREGERERAFYYSLDGIEGRMLFCFFVSNRSHICYTAGALSLLFCILKELKSWKDKVCVFVCIWRVCQQATHRQTWICVNMCLAKFLRKYSNAWGTFAAEKECQLSYSVW